MSTVVAEHKLIDPGRVRKQHVRMGSAPFQELSACLEIVRTSPVPGRALFGATRAGNAGRLPWCGIGFYRQDVYRGGDTWRSRT